jgi:pimeloyl-ACP methyl ester carboxylesterase
MRPKALVSPAPSGLTAPLLFHDNPQYWFETLRVIDAASYGASEFGEVVTTSQRITSGDADSWYDAWTATAERVDAEARNQFARGHMVSARDSFLRASIYYRTAEFFLHGNPSDPRLKLAYEKTVEAYKASAALFSPAIESIEIPYENTSLPGYLHRVDDSGARRPLLIMHTGFDGSAEEMHTLGVRAAVERGYNVLAFDGPGQFGPLHREGLKFRADWENVVAPVVDFALNLPEVAPEKIALMGASLGGYLAPRAAAFEKRLAAVIANDGVMDFGAAQLALMKSADQEATLFDIQADEAPEMDRLLTQLAQSSPTLEWAFAHGAYAFGAHSTREFLRKSLDYHLRDGIAEKISCPTLVCDAEGDLFFKGQPEELFKRLTCPKTLMLFTSREGSGSHCQVGAARLAFGRIYDWLDETLGVHGGVK